jgi:purine-binding chemotaxis protein CheW
VTGDVEAMRRELRVLRARISVLRRTLGAAAVFDDAPTAAIDLLFCTTHGPRIALPLPSVDEVVPIAATSELPGSSPWLHGILNLRGDAIPVFDVARRLGEPARRIALSDLVVVVRHEGSRAGLVVREVVDIRPFERADDSDDATTVAHAPFVVGAARDGAHVHLLVDVARLLAEAAPAESASETR